METIEEKAQYILTKLKENDYSFYAGIDFNIDGLPFYGYSDKTSIMLSLNLAHKNKPNTKSYYTGLVHQILRLYQEMLAVSPELKAFAQEKTFVAQLHVYSGQMDFNVCELKNEEIVWLSNVEE